MDACHKKILRALVLEMRHLLEGEWKDGSWIPGDLERRLRALGVRRDGSVVPVDEMSHLPAHDLAARSVIDAWLALRLEAGGSGPEASSELVRETAWSWANRLLALRCMEARGLVDDEVVVTRPVYAGRSMLHQRLVRRKPGLERTEDGGLFAALSAAFAERCSHLPRAFDPQAPGIALRPSVAALAACIALLSGTQRARGQDPATDDLFRAPDALGWVWQYWNAQEKGRVLDRAAGKGPDRVRHKIERADIVPATQFYTEPYMVQFLVQNGLGGLWASMHPDTALVGQWRYFVREAERPPVAPRPVREITFLDPACGSGHFLIEAFDLFFAMYREEDPGRDAVAIGGDVLRFNIFGLDIDERAVQVAEVSLWMKAAERALAEGLQAPRAAANLAATDVHLPKGSGQLDSFLEMHPEDEPLREALQVVFEGLEHADELGALLLLDEPVEKALRRIKQQEDERVAEAALEPQGRLFGRPAQTALPLTARSFEDWRADVLARVRDHFEEEARSADPARAFFGRQADRGFDVFALLAGRYDVVAANPPFMGSKNMGPVLRRHIEEHFAAGKRDLYAAFVLRCRDLLADGGRAAIVAPQAWLFMRSYAGMRAAPPTDPAGAYTGLLAETRIETLAQLGRHAFSEADPPGNVAMFVLQTASVDEGHRPVCSRLALPRPAEEQARLLLQAATGGLDGLTWRPSQRAFLDVPQAPFCYWLRPRLLRLFAGRTVSDVGEVRQGMATADDGRFLRFAWEVPAARGRWFPFYKGGGYRKWDGLANLVVDWEDVGARIGQTPGPRVQGKGHFFQPGWTYSLMARGRMGVRWQKPPGVIGHKGPGIYLRDDAFVAALNSRTFSHLLRAASPNMAFEVDSVCRGPVPESPPAVDVSAIVAAKARLTATDPTERAFAGVADLPSLLAWCAELHDLEGKAERAVVDAHGLGEDDIAAVIADTGTPAGWLPDDRSDAARGRVRALFEAGPGRTVEDEDGGAEDAGDPGAEDDDGAPEFATGRPIPPETFLEEICEKARVSPGAAWALIRDGIAAGWRCAAEEQRIAADSVSVFVLRLLGHRWPRQVEDGDPVPGWADADGIVPLASLPGERPLIDRMRDRWAEEGVVEADLSRALGMPVAQWVQTRFAAHHASRFRRRPAAWQVQSGPLAARRAPAFAALLYCQRASAEMLAALRSQYAGPLLERRRQEQRTLEAAAQRSPAQEQQLSDLGLIVEELGGFADKLEEVGRSGFSTPGLRAIAVREAVQSLVQPLLARWRGELQGGPMHGWAVDARSVDPSLAVALEDAAEALPAACSRWADLVDAPEWGDEAPEPADVRAAVLAVTGALVRAVSEALGEAVQDAFRRWMKGERERARSLLIRQPRFAREKGTVEDLLRLVDAWSPDIDGLPRFLDGLPLLDRWCGEPRRQVPATLADFVADESAWRPDVNDGVRVNVAPLQKEGLLACDVLAAWDVEPAIADRARWRADERRWVREGKLSRPGWWGREVDT